MTLKFNPWLAIILLILIGLPQLLVGCETKERMRILEELKQLRDVTLVSDTVLQNMTDDITARLRYKGSSADVSIHRLSLGSFDGTGSFEVWRVTQVSDILVYLPLPDISRYPSWTNNSNYRDSKDQGYHYMLIAVEFSPSSPGYEDDLFGNRIRNVQSFFDNYEYLVSRLQSWQALAIAERNAN